MDATGWRRQLSEIGRRSRGWERKGPSARIGTDLSEWFAALQARLGTTFRVVGRVRGGRVDSNGIHTLVLEPVCKSVGRALVLLSTVTCAPSFGEIIVVEGRVDSYTPGKDERDQLYDYVIQSVRNIWSTNEQFKCAA